MHYFKTPDNRVAALSDEDLERGGLELLPPDAVEIEEAEARALAAVAAVGPFNRDALMREARDRRKDILDALVGIGFAAKAAGDETTVAAVLAARQGLLDLTKDPALAAATTEAQFRAAVKARYAQLVMAAPANVQAAFREVAS